MTNERELLELAARAAGVVLSYGFQTQRFYINGTAKVWNPAHDDGDSDRFGTAIGADVLWLENDVRVDVGVGKFFFEHFANHNGDKQKALRWARLRAAAEIGRNMK